MDLCVYESEEREHGVGACVKVIIMSDVLYGIGLGESASSALPAFEVGVYYKSKARAKESI